ncbi:MAG: hypothetical protein RIT45_4255 [Pseudomonadota bacterium]
MSGQGVAEVSVAVDTGGTFTDLFAWSEDAHAPDHLRDGLALKVPSTPDDPGRAVLDAIAALRASVDAPLTLREVRHGSTVATNALLEDRTAIVALVVNEGFEDLLAIGRQARPTLYALQPRAPRPVVPRERVVGAPGRLDAEGREIAALGDLDAWLDVVGPRLIGAEVVAVCLLHAWRSPRHERRIADAIRARWPALRVVTSHEVAPYVREFERACTTAVQAAVAPRMADYLGRLALALAPVPLSVQVSSGALVPAAVAAARAATTVLSGPAGGVRGAHAAAASEREPKPVLALDIGGTSTDVAIVAGEPTPRPDGQIGDWPLLLPMLPIDTVGAGGGSVLWIDAGGALRVGPRSAGAVPGPACYGRVPAADALPTLTDAHAVLGRLGRALAGGVQADPDRARAAIAPLAARLDSDVETVAAGAIAIASATMARACRRVLAAAAIDPGALRLCAYGGAGALHACEVADELGVREVLVPAAAGVLSAAGIAAAPRAAEAGRAWMRRADASDAAAAFRAELDALRAEAADAFARDWPGARADAEPRIWADVRYLGQDRPLTLALATLADGALDALREAFEQEHARVFGHRLARPVQVVALRVRICEAERSADVPPSAPAGPPRRGPARIALDGATLWLPEDWVATPRTNGTWLAQRADAAGTALAEALDAPLAITVEVHRQRLEALAEEVGAVLERAALSPNIRERRDFSTAIFDGKGAMLAHAAHIPVHLGSTPLAVAAAIASGRLDAADGGDVVLNDPFAGGTHNPDITMVRRAPSGAFHVANRAHHADVGGIEPGSMPAPVDREGRWRRVTIDDEGYRCGPEVCDAARRAAFAAASRTPDERHGDLLAQQAANRAGVAMLERLTHELGPARLASRNAALLAHGERRMRAVLAALPDGAYHAEDVLDAALPDGAPLPLRVTIHIAGDGAVVDLQDAPDAVDAPLNAVRAVTLSAVFYAFRIVGGALAGGAGDLPANAGLLRPIEVRTRPGSVLDARPPAAVSAGNVETSQRLCDLLLRALAQAAPDRVPAASAGSMSNVLLGHPDGASGAPWVHYETLGGGGGGGPAGPGADGLHVHMTNTRNTPVEALELAFPLRVAAYRLRTPPAVTPGTDGREGVQRGGVGVLRVYEALAPIAVTLLGERRIVAPWGLWGAPDGVPGCNRIRRADGREASVAGVASVLLEPGDALSVETPSGGAWRAPPASGRDDASD